MAKNIEDQISIFSGYTNFNRKIMTTKTQSVETINLIGHL